MLPRYYMHSITCSMPRLKSSIARSSVKPVRVERLRHTVSCHALFTTIINEETLLPSFFRNSEAKDSTFLENRRFYMERILPVAKGLNYIERLN